MAVRLPAPLIAVLDDRATRIGASRAQVIRSILQTAMDPAGPDGVDRAQIRRMLRMTPAERVRRGDFKSVLAVIEALADGVVT